jgi:cysteine desulfurase
MIYLDNSAGSRPHPEVIKTITDVLTNHWGNASADNSFGKDAMTIIDMVTNQVADDIGCNFNEIIWTSGACEANSLAIIGVLGASNNMHFYTTHIEHTSIDEIVENISGHCVGFIRNDQYGAIDMIDLERKLHLSHELGAEILVSVSAANSEIGVIQDLATIADVVHRYGGILHVDATQAYPWYQINIKDLGIDLMSVSGQKMNCVKGVGFLYVRNNIQIKPLICGAQQEKRRGGTYPTHLIAAFGKALEITRQHEYKSKISQYRDRMLCKLLTMDNVRVNGPTNGLRLPNNISLTIDGVNAEALTTMCDLMGVILAKGSACKSHSPEPSKTLMAVGLTEEDALNTIRISLDMFNTEEEIDQAAEIITALVERIRLENE